MAPETSRPTAGEVRSKRSLQGFQNWFQLPQQFKAGSLRKFTVSISEPTGGLTVSRRREGTGQNHWPTGTCVSSEGTSPFGVIPKRHSPGKWRLILDLSNPSGSSVNDGINPELCSLSYISVDDVARVVALLGRGTMLGKTNIKSAYRIIPVHPADRLLLGM